MIVLSNVVIRKLRETPHLRRVIALKMGVGEAAILLSLRRNMGRSIAKNIFAIKALILETGLTESEIIDTINESTLCPENA